MSGIDNGTIQQLDDNNNDSITKKSLLQDASTLLLFSKGDTSSAGSNTATANTSSQNVLSPGPAALTLLNNDVANNNKSRMSQTSPSTADANQKGLLAAAALAEAATNPLPPKKNNHSASSTDSTSKIYKEETQRNISQGTIKETPKEEAKIMETTAVAIPDDYIVDIDSGIITCICGFEDDDGFTIQCDHCHRWQHGICFGIDLNFVPEDFLCNVCQPRKDINIKFIKELQKKRLKENNKNKNLTIVTDPKAIVYSDSNSNTSLTNINSTTNITGTTGVTDSPQSSKKRKRNPSSSGNNNRRNNDSRDSSNEKDSNNHSSNSKKRKSNASTLDPNYGNKDGNIDSDFLISAEKAYDTLYTHLIENEYKDKYIKLFLDNHKDDDCVVDLINSAQSFEPIPINIKSYTIDVENNKGNETNNDTEEDSTQFKGFTQLGVFISKDCSRSDLIHEYLGIIDFNKNYLLDSKNQYRIWGTTKPKVFFHSTWPIFIDSRLSGNLARYLRRSCNPNVELVTIKTKEKASDSKIKFVLRATRDIKHDEELTLPWNWDLNHPIRQLIPHNNDNNDIRSSFQSNIDSMDEKNKFSLIYSINTILKSCDCACLTNNNTDNCLLLKIKKYSLDQLNSINMNTKHKKYNNIYKMNEYLNNLQKRFLPKIRPAPILENLVLQTEKYNTDLQIYKKIQEMNQAKESKNVKKIYSNVNIFTNTKDLTSTLTNTLEESQESILNKRKFPQRFDLLRKKFRSNNILSKHRKNNDSLPSLTSSNDQIIHITKLLEFDESKVTDINLLPTPIELATSIPSLYNKQMNLDNNNIQDTSNRESSSSVDPLQTHSYINDSNTPISANSLPSTSDTTTENPINKGNIPANDNLSNSNVQNNCSQQLKPMRKKLSFADYRKKLNK
ncbi:hypothetical protein TBLA_0D05520 [Henningerozyma blattae CBS 6284]|uniref:SET domain-containing protein n=1 Tax=Henningerozyma blattae (strain ATCC 34711 / CBS 6284 / DSM 70876 / NBRC 10599 / NRRL Y-10934 / UCD 77-7) TaxID=1071380 RepID=I2H3U2_HENB6|nr:hypothetical protein TBLA_0D05520 [Tetrapisispora blattae CBS 6284]CCH61044.1 hypothetical protein TBLA_0D05520 [Tetrapisispora blattae CBS 6284]